MRWTCICFDLDNTLFDYEKTFKEGMLFSFQRFFSDLAGEEISKDLWFKKFKINCDELYIEVEQGNLSLKEYKNKRFCKTMAELGIETSNRTAEQFQQFFYSNLHHFLTPFHGVIDFIRFLHKKKISVGIITNGAIDTQMRKIDHLGLNKILEKSEIIISDQYGYEKPQQEIFNIALHKLSNTQSKALFIGDSWDQDVVGAIEAGWDSIYLNSRQEHPTTNHLPKSICYDFEEVQERVIHFLS